MKIIRITDIENVCKYIAPISLTINEPTLSPVKHKKNMIWFVMLDNNKTVGFSAYYPLSNRYILKSAYIIPEYRRKGYYKKLLLCRLNELHNKTIESNINNILIPLYKTLGFAIVTKYKKHTKVKRYA